MSVLIHSPHQLNSSPNSNYDQIGLKFKLFSAEILFNKGLTQINLGYEEEGMVDMKEASRLKVMDEHGVIDEAMQDRGQGYTVFSIVRDTLSWFVFVWHLN